MTRSNPLSRKDLLLNSLEEQKALAAQPLKERQGQLSLTDTYTLLCNAQLEKVLRALLEAMEALRCKVCNGNGKTEELYMKQARECLACFGQPYNPRPAALLRKLLEEARP